MPPARIQVGPYKIDRELGRGGMGEVYLARDTRLDRQVALKALPDLLAHDPDRLARFQREAKVLASLSHSGIAAIYGLEEDAGHQFLILEYVDGQTLAERLRRGPIPVDEALNIARQVADALEAAHEKGVIHRDLKPGNIIVTADGTAKVLDFGLARAADGAPPSTGAVVATDSPTVMSPTPEPSPTIPGAIMGTAGYMSPEQARGKVVDKRSDIFAFGCVLFEMLSGVGPFRGETVTDSLGAILHREPDWKLLPSSTPARVRELLSNCLTKDRKGRLHDIGDARLELDRAIADNEWTLTPAKDRLRNRKLFVSLSIVAALVLIALGAGLWSALGRRTRAGGGEPICLTIAIPPEITVAARPPGAPIEQMYISRDGRTLVVRDQPKNQNASGAATPRIFTRRLDNYEFKPLAGTEGALFGGPCRDNRTLLFLSPVLPGSAQKRLAVMPLDGSAPATTITDSKDSWRSGVELASGDLLITEGEANYVRIPKGGGAPSAPMKLDAGRSGIAFFAFDGEILPGDRGVFMDVVLYDARGFHYSVGVMDPHDGKVKVIVEDGGHGIYSPTGHLLFSRGGVILAVPFDLERAEVRGTPLAVWSGLSSLFLGDPAFFQLTDQGALFYRPGQAGGERPLGFLSPEGKVTPLSTERWPIEGNLALSPDGRRFACSLVNARLIDEIWISLVDHPDFVRLGSDPNADCGGASWSPDGSRIAYFRRGKDGRDGIYIQNADGGEAKRVFKAESVGLLSWYVSGWLQDSSALLLGVSTAEKNTVMLLPLDGTEADISRLRPLVTGSFNSFGAKTTSDGQLVAFLNDETAKFQIWVAELRAGAIVGRPVQVKSSSGVSMAAWAADGKTIFFQDDRNWLMKVSITNGPPPAASAPMEVADLEKLGIQSWSVAPDGRFLVALKNENEGATTQYHLVLNWTELLNKKLPTHGKSKF